MDVPVVAEIDGRRLAELRINATNFRGYDTRSDDRLTWAKATGMHQAASPRALVCCLAR
jgi:hypothetical protein